MCSEGKLILGALQPISPFMKKILTALLLLLGVSGSALAQISGKVADARDNSPVIGASVSVKGTSDGTATDAAGSFKLPASVGTAATLVVRALNFTTQEVPLNGRSAVTVQLTGDNQVLAEVVVTALGVSRQTRSLGYAVQTLDSKQLTNVQDPNLINNIAGKVAGVNITNGGAGVGSTSRIVIRGENSFSGTNQPLFVVDGVPISNDTYFNDAVGNSSGRGTWAEVDWGNGAAEVNPNDVEQITVLKGGAAAALYGSRAANGAVVLTTKRGLSDPGAINVTFNSTNLISTPLRTPAIQGEYGAGNGTTPYRYVDGAQGFENNIPNYGAHFDPNLLVPQFNSPAGPYLAADLAARGTDPNKTPITPTPWQGHPDNFKNFLQTGFTTINNISLSTLTKDGSSIRFSYGNLTNRGIIPNSDLYRHMFSLRADTKFTDKLTANTYINFINSKSNERPNIGYGSESVMYTFFGVYGMPVNIDLNALKNQHWQAGQDQTQQFRYWANHDNPYVTVYDNTNSFQKNRLLGNASLTYQLTPELSLMGRTGLDFYSDNREGHRAFSTVRFPLGGFRTDDVTYVENNTDALLTYNKQATSDIHFDASVGANRFIQHVTYNRAIASDLITPGLYSFANARTLLPPLVNKTNRGIYSIYGFADFSYKTWLFLNVTGRNDWSSTLPAGRNSYFYPSASLSTVISDLVTLPAPVSYFKLRVSAAQVGRDVVPYSINNTFTTPAPFGTYPLTTGNNVLAGSSLRPSSTTTEEVGADIRFFRNRLGLDLTVYNSDTKDEIVQLPIPISSGYTNAFVNGGKIRNQGVEAILRVTPVQSADPDGFNWNFFFNFSHNVGRVRALPEGVSTYKYAEVTQYDRYFRSIEYNAVVGDRLGNIYGNKFVRDAQDRIVYDKGIPVVSTGAKQLLGNYNPDFILGYSNTLSYKGVSLVMTWDWHKGGVIYSYTRLGLLNGGFSPETLPGRDTNSIVGDGVKLSDGTTNNVAVPASTYYLGYYNANNNEVFTYSASYLKLRELRLGYTFNHVFGGESKSSLNVSLIGRNLLLFSAIKDIDPETLALRGDRILPGIEFNSIPSTRDAGFSLGLNF